MKDKMISKALAVAVIILFISMGVQPAFADDNPNLEKENNDIEIEFTPDLYITQNLLKYDSNKNLIYRASVFTRFGEYNGTIHVKATEKRLLSGEVTNIKEWDMDIHLKPFDLHEHATLNFNVGYYKPGLNYVTFEIFPEEPELFKANNVYSKVYRFNIFGFNMRMFFVVFLEFILSFFTYPWVS